MSTNLSENCSTILRGEIHKSQPYNLVTQGLDSAFKFVLCMVEKLGLTTALLRVACEERMILRSKTARGRTEPVPEKEAKQHRPYESPTESPHCIPMEEPGPSEREIKAAVAARERLYGSKAGDADCEASRQSDSSALMISTYGIGKSFMQLPGVV